MTKRSKHAKHSPTLHRDDPLRAFHDNVESDIKQYGRSIVGVCGDDGSHPFAYTIGNYRQAMLPELLVIGVMRAGFLNDLSQQMIDAGQPFKDGQIVLLPGAEAPLKMIRANNTARTEYAVQAGVHFGHDNYSIMQVLLSDHDGKFPGETGCQPPYSDVRVLRMM
jgi:hypothetical protein